ncbi:hypothetical protein [Labilibaculum sp.]|uniref:hypothetical protein n=1 Tax=Labilibaculum sp. TaxID=2060723 RepID=UPI002AA73AD7|nr:hypothetical protein [Labilibaculum sp.]
MKKNYLNLIWLAVAAIFFVSCSDDNDPVVPKLSITADVVEISETATSALVVKVNADAVLETAYTVGLTLSGTAVEGVNFQEIAKTVTIPANGSSATIFVTPINVSAIEDSKTVSIELKAGTAYELTATTSVAITIIDNANPPSDAPEVSFATSNMVTNPYLEEVKTITVGLSKTFSSDLIIPLTISGDLLADTDYELAGLSNDAITIPAGSVSADFTVTMKNTAVVGMNKTLDFAFTTPSVTDYAVKATENTVSVNAVDPQVDFSAWFNDDNQYGYFYEDWTTPTITYKTDLEGYWLMRYYFDSVAQDWKTLTGEHYTNVSLNDNNQWSEVINKYQRLLGANNIDIAEQERHEQQAGDYLGLVKFFSNEATYSKTEIKAEKGWFRFVSTDASATEGTVVVPEQTLTFYKADMAVWKAKTTVDVDGGTESYYAWYADSNTTQGDISQSTMVTPVSIQVAKSVGTYNTATKEIQVDITFTCDDVDFSIDPKYYISNDGNSYTMSIKYMNRF